jgi:hypothetical protein
MPINLEEHKVYVDSHKMEMVPLSIAQDAMNQLVEQYEEKLDAALVEITNSLTQINKVIEEND